MTNHADKLRVTYPEASPSKPRPMEYVWALISLVLLMGHIMKDDVSDSVVLERQHAILKEQCQKIEERAVQYAGLITTLLDRGGQLMVKGEVVAVCYRRKS